MPLFHNFIFSFSSNIFFLNHAPQLKYQHGPLKVNGVSLTLHAFEVYRIVSSKSLDDRVLCSYSFMYSWWWVRWTPQTCRV